jgi:hypothetical protein
MDEEAAREIERRRPNSLDASVNKSGIESITSLAVANARRDAVVQLKTLFHFMSVSGSVNRFN